MINDMQIAIRVPLALLAEIDEMRRAEPDLPTRAEMMRRFARQCIAARQRAPQASPPHHDPAHPSS